MVIYKTIQGHTSIDVVDLDRRISYGFEDLSKQMDFTSLT